MSNPSHELAPKKRCTPGQRERLIRQFHSSGVSQAGFCRRHGLHPATLSLWLRNTAVSASAEFQEVRVSPPARGAVEIALVCGAVVRIREESWLVPVLRAIREAGSC